MYVHRFKITCVCARCTASAEMLCLIWCVYSKSERPSECWSTCQSRGDYANPVHSMHEHVWAHIKVGDYTLFFLSKTFLWSLGWCTRQSNHEIDTQSPLPDHIHVQMNHLNCSGRRTWAFLVIIHQYKISAFQYVLCFVARIWKPTVSRTFFFSPSCRSAPPLPFFSQLAFPAPVW